jgi:uncharacterized protein YggT (Ycf19 family)
MNLIFQLIDTFINVFLILITITALLSWFPQFRSHPLAQMILAITMPYISFFRRHFPLQFGFIDGSFLIAVVFLIFIQRTVMLFYHTGRFSIVTVLLFFSDIFFTVFNVLFTFTAIFAVIRFISLTFMHSNGPFSMMLDQFLRRPIALVGSVFARRRVARYTTLLLILAIISFIISRAVVFAHSYASYLISHIPL